MKNGSELTIQTTGSFRNLANSAKNSARNLNRVGEHDIIQELDNDDHSSLESHSLSSLSSLGKNSSQPQPSKKSNTSINTIESLQLQSKFGSRENSFKIKNTPKKVISDKSLGKFSFTPSAAKDIIVENSGDENNSDDDDHE